MRQNHTGSSKAPKAGTRQVNQVTTRQVNQATGPVSQVTSPLRGGETSKRSAPLATQRAGGQPVAPAPVEAPKGMTGARYDRPGHLADAHAERLLHLSRQRGRRDEFALVFDSAAGDDLATELAEQAVTSMVGGGETWLDTINAQVEEEEGGPFVETRADREFASGPAAEDDTQGFFREALPTLSAGNSVPFEGVRRGRRP